MNTEGLEKIERTLGALMGALSPAGQRAMLLKIGQQVRRDNLARMRANTTPDGAAMAPRKNRRKGLRGKMFKKLATAGKLKIERRHDVTVRWPNPRDAFTVTSPNSHFTGEVTALLLKFIGGLMGAGATGGANASIAGNLSVTGNVSVSGGDITADAVSLKKHTHTVIGVGSPTSVPGS